MQPASSPSSPARPDAKRQRLITLLKVGVTALGLVLVLRTLDLTAVLTLIGDVQWRWMGIGAALMVLSLIIRAYRWHIVLRGTGSHVRFGRLVALYFVGSFFNAFLPSGLGGDVVRAAEAAQDVDAGVAAGTVLVDRLTGLMALFALALAVLPFRPDGFPPSPARVIGGLCGAGLAVGVVLIDGRLFRRVARLLPSGVRAAGNGFLDRFAAAVDRCEWRALGGALLVSVVFNLVQVAWWATTGRALGLDIPYSYYLLVVPILSIALLVPSIGGLGVREVLAPLLFTGAGITTEQAVALTLLVFGLERVASLLGAPVYLYSTLRVSRLRPESPPRRAGR